MKKNGIFIKLIIVEKFILGAISVLLSLGMLNLINKDMEKFANGIVILFNLDMNDYYIEAFIHKLGMIGNGTIIGISIGMIFYGALNLIEAYGLHKRRRWAEWLTVIATALFIPFEIYKIFQDQTLIRIVALVLNSFIVYYLAKHKELFSSRYRNIIASEIIDNPQK